jgi:hypothetical protein
MKKYHWPYFILIIFVFILVYPYVFNAKLFLGGDNASYYSLARGIAEKFEYYTSFSPIPVPNNHYPPGYPFILAIAIKIGVTSLTGLKILSGLFLLGSSILAYLLAFRFTQNRLFSALIAVATLFNMHLLEYGSITMSEVPFLFFILLTFYAFIRFVDNQFKLKSWSFYLTVFGVLAVVYIRTQGIAVIGAFLFYLLLNKQFKVSAVLTLCFIIGYLPWQIRSASLGGSTYVQQLLRVDPYLSDSKKMEFSDWGTRIKNNAVRYVSKEIPSLIFPVKPTVYNDPKSGDPVPASGVQWVIGFVVIGFSLFGIWRLNQLRWLLLSFFGANFVIFLLWPDVWFGIRFILPLAPLILIVFFIGIKFFLELLSKHDFIQSGKIYPVLMVPYLLINFPTIKILHLKAEANHAPNWANYLYVGEWAKDKLKRTDVVVTRKPELFYFVADTKTKTFIYTDELDTLKADFELNKVTHVVFEQLGFSQTGKFLYPLLLKEPDRFELLYSLGSRDAVDAKGNKVKTQDGVWLYAYHLDRGYFGSYKNGLKEGSGKYVYSNGDTFEGSWVNDTIEGTGTYLQKNGQFLKGEWKKGKREGKFIITSADKKQIIESYWKSNEIEPMGYFIDSLGNRKGSVKLR